MSTDNTATAAIPLRPLRVRIVRREAAATEIVRLELRHIDNIDLPAFEAGAHVDVEVAPGLVRQYSLCNDPAERHRYCLGILRDPASRGGSQTVHDRFEDGQLITIGWPRNHFPLHNDGAPAVLVAGGIGITPLLAMAHALQARSTPFSLHYCVRSRDRAAFFGDIVASAFGPALQLHLDDGPSEQRLSLDAVFADRHAHVYCCGPEGFIGHVTGGATSRGWPTGQLHVEHFKVDVSQDGNAFLVEARRSGVTVSVPSGVTVAKALMDAGVPVALSCEQGVCGSCLTPVLDGIPEHRDQYQTDEEKLANSHMTPCCSRSCSQVLVLDI